MNRNLTVRKAKLKPYQALLLVFCIGAISISGTIKTLVNNNENVLYWQQEKFPDVLANSQAIVIQHDMERIYVVGGEQSIDAISDEILYSTIGENGVLGKWNQTLPLSIPLKNHTVVSFGTRVYVIGGQTNPDEFADTYYSYKVFCAELESGGKITRWYSQNLGISSNDWLAYHASVSTNDRIYLIGGYKITGATNQVKSAHIGSDCSSLLTWRAENSLLTDRVNHAATIVTLENEEGEKEEYVFVAGGWYKDNGIYKLKNDIERAKVQEDGKLSDWTILGAIDGMPAMQRLSLVTSGNYLYVIGGSPSITADLAVNTVYRAEILDNAELGLGPWVKLNSLSENLHSSATAVSSLGSIYIIGGDASNDVFRDTTFHTPLAWFSKVSTPSEDVFPGDVIKYDIEYTNNGLQVLSNVVITDIIPSNTWLINSTFPTNSEIITHFVGSLAMNQSGTFSFEVEVQDPLETPTPLLSDVNNSQLDSVSLSTSQTITTIHGSGQGYCAGSVSEPMCYVDCPLESKENRYILSFSTYEYLRSDQTIAEATSSPVCTFIPDGYYDVTLVSYDNHSAKPYQNQLAESWHLIFRDKDGVEIEQTNPIDDLPENQDWLTQTVNTQLKLTSPIESVVAFHSAFPDQSSPNSIMPVCAALDLSHEIVTPTITPTITATPTVNATPTQPPPTSTPQPVIVTNQAWLCEGDAWCIKSNLVMNTPNQVYLPVMFK